MGIYRVVIEKSVVEFYLVEANSEEEAQTVATEGTMVQPDSTEEMSTIIVDIEEVK